MTETISGLGVIEQFQNFSSLQFMLKDLITINQKKKHFKTFQVYSSFYIKPFENSEVKFQNFSSLQFINLQQYNIEQIKLFQNFSSLQFIKIIELDVILPY